MDDTAPLISPAFQRTALKTGCIALYAALSLYVMAVFLIGSNLGLDNNVFEGPRTRPAAYRVLMPALTQVVRSVLPQAAEDAITPVLIGMRDSELGDRLIRLRYNLAQLPQPLWDNNLFGLFVKMLVVYLSLLAFLWMLYKLTRALFPASTVYACVSPLLMLLVIPVCAAHYAYTYDFAELFFSCACFYLLCKERWAAYLLCLALATLNKETTIFGIFFYCMWFYNKLPLRQYVTLALYQLLIFAAIKGGINIYFADRPGLMVGQFTWESNLFHTWEYDYQDLMALVLTFILLTYRWQEKPAFLRGGTWMLLPHGIVYFAVINFREYRDLYWSMPVLILLATHTVVRLTGLERLQVFQPVPAEMS